MGVCAYAAALPSAATRSSSPGAAEASSRVSMVGWLVLVIHGLTLRAESRRDRYARQAQRTIHLFDGRVVEETAHDRVA